MQTRSSSTSSVATGTTRKQYTAEETEILMQKINEKEKQLKKQAEALQAKNEHLTKMQEEMSRKEMARAQEQPAVEQLMASMQTITSYIERIEPIDISPSEESSIDWETNQILDYLNSEEFLDTIVDL